jgi:hypothetical protein
MTDEVYVEVKSPGLDEKFEGLRDFTEGFEGYETTEFISEIVLSVGSTGGAAHIFVVFQRDAPAAVFGVNGWDRTWVEGAAAQLEEAIRKNEQRMRWEAFLTADPFFVVLPLSVVALPLAAIARGLVLAVAAIVAAGILLAYVMASTIARRYRSVFELVPEGGQTKWMRERRRVQTAAGTGTTLIVGAVVYAVASRLIG